jgi:tetraacyldisaccharide 4'-kinase
MAIDKNDIDHPPLPVLLARSPLPKLASLLYGGVVRMRNAAYDRFPSLSHPAKRPVISIGSIRAGGTGKTPLALLTAEYLLSKGYAAAFLSRGYRRKEKKLRIVKPGETVSWESIGDEPALLHERLPGTWLGIDGDRCAAAAALAPLLPERAAFILDDGFQHRSIRRDLDIVCLHRAPFIDRLIPLGYLREQPSSLARAQAIVLIGKSREEVALHQDRSNLSARFPSIPIFSAVQQAGPWINLATGESVAIPPCKEPLLLCGIARPERFSDLVRQAGIVPRAKHFFSDHHPFTTDDFTETHELYSKGIITTEKDAARLKKLNIVPADVIWYLTIELRFTNAADQAGFFSLIDKTIQ